MFDTIFIGTSGLISHSKGLRIVGNNLANVNTPGFKSAQSVFSDLFEQGGGAAQHQPGTASSYAVGTGVTTVGAKINFNAGLDQSTGNALDLNINGNGFYAIRRDDTVMYTRAGDFRFDDNGILVNSAGDHVLGLSEGGVVTDITSKNADRNPPKATSTVTVQGNLSTTITTPVTNAAVSNITVYDGEGINHPINLAFSNIGSGQFTVTATEVGAAAGTKLGTATLKFTGGFPVAGSDKLRFTYAPAGAAPFDVTVDFSKGVTALTTSNTIAFGAQDGYIAGVQTAQSIDADGNVVMHYSNGQTANVARIALANFASDTDLEQTSGAAFLLKPGAVAQYGFAGAGGFGTLVAGHREGSNVDLAEEFSNLILMQRGYQAASHVISTANDMIQQLFDMKGNG
jgi:flagellar hook protein FlgE